MDETKQMILLGNANRLLAKVKDASGAQKLMAMAHAAEVYARKAKMSQDAIDHAFTIRIDAQRMLGQFLAKGVWPGKRNILSPSSDNNSGKLPPDVSPNLSSESQFLAKIAEDDQVLFQSIRNREKTLNEARRELKRTQMSGKVQEFPSGKYRVIYADPPWSYNDKCDDGGVQGSGAEHHYPSMTIQELCALPIPTMTDENSVLFLWTTAPLLFECEPVFKSWGFNYKTCFIWDKEAHNMGHYSSVRHEILLVCVKGSCTPDNPKLFDSVQTIPKTPKHSEKPEHFRTMIDTLYTKGNKIELFARKKTDGWESWGNE